jgi:hypothetical protein
MQYGFDRKVRLLLLPDLTVSVYALSLTDRDHRILSYP